MTLPTPLIPHSPGLDDLSDAAQNEDVPLLGPSDLSDSGSDSLPAVRGGTRPAAPEDESADPVGHGETEPDGSPLPAPAPAPSPRRRVAGPQPTQRTRDHATRHRPSSRSSHS